MTTPPGYSCLITPVLNDFSLANQGLNFYSAVVDTDIFKSTINLPFSFSNFSGKEVFIPKGKPLVQVIPFKREGWEKEVAIMDPMEMLGNIMLLGSKFKDVYRDFMHKKKTYL